MKRLWTGLGILGIAVTLISCSSNTDQPDQITHYKTPVQKPCIIPTNLANNALGQLGIQVIQIGNNIRIVIPSDKVFYDRSAEIRDTAYPALDELASTLSPYQYRRMVVAGYTDELGTYHRDQVLSLHQAQNLITYLWTKGISHDCLTPIGIGKDDAQTVASNRSIEGKAANRRIEITFRV